MSQVAVFTLLPGKIKESGVPPRHLLIELNHKMAQDSANTIWRCPDVHGKFIEMGQVIHSYGMGIGQIRSVKVCISFHLFCFVESKWVSNIHCPPKGNIRLINIFQ